uniref:Uncharacterized protein n=1 Tax=Spumella elongata TaxID=89044 RepID=A0A7S3HC00_9STRA|mmetsp:Transcript_44921/g.78416  ORF Transcript_44921/g.78416 Transcript_44921/m.78416 type:complete len:496 (+) Transcript_44921:34-1521(+)
MNSLSKIVLFTAVVGSAANEVPPPIGFGVQRLKNFNSKSGLLKTTTTCPEVDQYWYKDAVVDNFAPVEHQQKWAGEGQRYWINRQFWGGVGFPVLVFIGGEGAESCNRLTSRMYAYNLAQEHRAMLVDVEHRFYGESYPTADMSTSNLKYLSADQALADLARIIGHIKSDFKTKDSKVITIGGSYPGNLAGWFRLKYPSVTHGSIASSAPVIAQTNFPEYMDVVGQALIHFSGQKCFDAFESAAEKVASYINAGDYTRLETDFKTCSKISSTNDLKVLLGDLMGNVQGTIQYNNEHNGVMNATDICATMTASTDYYANFVSLQALYRTANGQECEDASWADTVAYLSNPTKDSTNAGRPWTYQTCNEFGYYQTADSQTQPFRSWKWLDLQFSRDICYAAFNGWTSDPQVEWINQNYGDIHIAGTNIAFPSGTIDPWHALGVQNSTAALLPQPTEQSVFIEGTAHCADLYAPANSDPESLKYAREVIRSLVSKWLA